MTSKRRTPDAGIDWQQVHARLAQAAAMTRQALAPSEERSALLLEARARRLAQPLAVPRPAVMLDLLTLSLSGERYAIETRYVQEVSRLTNLAPVPGVPEFVAGVANLRGQILVVFDIGPVFGFKARGPSEATRVVVCGHAEPDLALLVDDVSEVILRAADELTRGTARAGGCGEPFVRGVTSDAIVVIDGAALLADRRFFVESSHRQ
jgi:purine-binding chemotaxis protein CheW